MWYVLQVKTGSEAHMKDILERFLPDGLVSDVFYPLYEDSYKQGGVRSVVTRLLFPGYLFLDTQRIDEVEKYLERITEQHSLLPSSGKLSSGSASLGNGFPGKVCTAVSSKEQEFLTSHTDHRHVMTMSLGYMTGREVVITEGAFAGYCGELEYVDRHNRYGVMRVRLGERDVNIRFGLEIVRKERAM
ncbi:MAG: hypothetical protein NC543_03015 [bacterium]|nr:hypothetical protein [bacterium]MCM1376582.1 hypothetical protein [Muribaculum sp.]